MTQFYNFQIYLCIVKPLVCLEMCRVTQLSEVKAIIITFIRRDHVSDSIRICLATTTL